MANLLSKAEFITWCSGCSMESFLVLRLIMNACKIGSSDVNSRYVGLVSALYILMRFIDWVSVSPPSRSISDWVVAQEPVKRIHFRKIIQGAVINFQDWRNCTRTGNCPNAIMLVSRRSFICAYPTKSAQFIHNWLTLKYALKHSC